MVTKELEKEIYRILNFSEAQEMMRLLVMAGDSAAALPGGATIFQASGTFSEGELLDMQNNPITIVAAEDGSFLYPIAGFIDNTAVATPYGLSAVSFGFYCGTFVPFDITQQAVLSSPTGADIDSATPIVKFLVQGVSANTLLAASAPIIFSYSYDGVTVPGGTGDVKYYLAYLKFPRA